MKKKNQITKRDKNIWTEREREAWKLPEQITVSQWSDKNRILNSKTSSEPGQWRTSRTPYLKGPMDAFSDPLIEEITIMAASQIGKTEAIHNMLGYAIDQDPGPALYVMPRENDAKSMSYNRVKPMMESSPALSRHLPQLSDDVTKLEYNLDHMMLTFVGANSPAALAARPIRYVLFDEVDKFPKFSGKEADPIKLGTERTKTFWNKKIIKVSTPTTKHGYIFREYEKSSKLKFYVPCPYCSAYQVLVFDQIKWPENESRSENIRMKNLAWYECIKCKQKIFSKDKQKILSNGLWAPDGSEITSTGKIKYEIPKAPHAGFWISALYSPWLSWSDIAAEFLNSKDYPELLMNFVNSWLAEIWEEKTEETKPEMLAARADIYEEGVVPNGVVVLTAGVDVQKDHFYLVIRGWGYQEESWLIRVCRVESWEEVESILFLTHYSNNNKSLKFPVMMACIDSAYRTDEVYEFCRKWKDKSRSIKGHDHLAGAPYTISYIDRTIYGGKAIKGGLKLWHIDTSHYKDKITRMVQSEPGDPAQWHLFKGISNRYLKQFCSENKILIVNKKTGRTHEEWRLITQGRPNHYLDAEVYAAAAADMLRVSSMRKGMQPLVYRPKKSTESKKKSSSWIRQSKGKWLNNE
jgi:phage terminase large subunit GpA-like protein